MFLDILSLLLIAVVLIVCVYIVIWLVNRLNIPDPFRIIIFALLAVGILYYLVTRMGAIGGF